MASATLLNPLPTRNLYENDRHTGGGDRGLSLDSARGREGEEVGVGSPSGTLKGNLLPRQWDHSVGVPCARLTKVSHQPRASWGNGGGWGGIALWVRVGFTERGETPGSFQWRDQSRDRERRAPSLCAVVSPKTNAPSCWQQPRRGGLGVSNRWCRKAAAAEWGLGGGGAAVPIPGKSCVPKTHPHGCLRSIETEQKKLLERWGSTSATLHILRENLR